MIRTGTTSFSDMYFFSEDVIRAVGESGVKCNFSRAITSFQDGDIHELASFQESEKILGEWHNAFDGRLKIDMSLHAEYTNRRTIIEQFADIAAAHGVRAHIHLSETEKEHEECKQRHGGMTPAALFDRLRGVPRADHGGALCLGGGQGYRDLPRKGRDGGDQPCQQPEARQRRVQYL